MGKKLTKSNYKRFSRIVKRRGIDISHLNDNVKHKFLSYLTINSKISNSYIKRKIIEYSIIEYKCTECSNDGKWINKELVLELDHINGKPTDNRIENLRFLCPNCHSQTETYCGKKRSDIMGA